MLYSLYKLKEKFMSRQIKDIKDIWIQNFSSFNRFFFLKNKIIMSKLYTFSNTFVKFIVPFEFYSVKIFFINQKRIKGCAFKLYLACFGAI